MSCFTQNHKNRGPSKRQRYEIRSPRGFAHPGSQFGLEGQEDRKISQVKVSQKAIECAA